MALFVLWLPPPAMCPVRRMRLKRLHGLAGIRNLTQSAGEPR